MKSLAILTVVFCLSAMTCHKQASAQKHQTTTQNDLAPTITVNNYDRSKHEESKKDDVTRWWPEGVTAVAIIFTLFAIIYQARQSRRAVDAALEQAKIANRTLTATFRPKLSIRAMKFDVSQALSKTDSFAIWKLVLANVGGSVAHIKSTIIVFDLLVEDVKDEVYSLGTEDVGGFDLAAGQIENLTSKLTNIRQIMSVGKFGGDSEIGQYAWIRCSGSFIFVDDNGIERRVGFRRRYNVKTGSFHPDPDPEYEFDDET
jgi:hypothetical protein